MYLTISSILFCSVPFFSTADTVNIFIFEPSHGDNLMSIMDEWLLSNGTYMCSRTHTHTYNHTAGQPTLKLIHISCACQSQATTGCLLLLLEQYIKTQRARHLLPLSPRILSVCVSLSLSLCLTLALSSPPSPSAILPLSFSLFPRVLWQR